MDKEQIVRLVFLDVGVGMSGPIRATNDQIEAHNTAMSLRLAPTGSQAILALQPPRKDYPGRGGALGAVAAYQRGRR